MSTAVKAELKGRAVSPHLYRLLMSKRRAERWRRAERQDLQQNELITGVQRG